MQIKITESVPLLSCLALHYPDTAQRRLRSWIAHGRVAVDGFLVSKDNFPLLAGQTLWVDTQCQPASLDIQILFQDQHLIAIYKPAGLLSVATDFSTGLTAHDALKRACHPSRIFVVHRLDKGTSGVMLFAKSQEGLEGLKKLLKDHAICREYLAVVEGKVEPAAGSWRSYLREDKAFHVHECADARQGELAITHFETLDYAQGRSWLKVTLETGKKNQIRVHTAAAGHPVCGDEKYGAKTNPIGRIALHAYRLTFVHPVTGRSMVFQAPVPLAFGAIRANCKL